MRRRFQLILIYVLLFGITLSGCGLSKDKLPVKKEFFALDTVINLTLYGDNADKAAQAAYGEIKRLENLFSTTAEDSDIYKINSCSGSFVKVSKDTVNIILLAKKLSEKTNGDFDISVYPIVKSWGFTTENYNVPDDNTLEELKKKVDYSKIDVDEEKSAVKIQKGMAIDLGAVAKGYITQKVGEVLKANGETAAIINLGGNIMTLGEKSNGEQWNVAVTDPFNTNNTCCTIKIKETSVITSGSYQRFFERNGKRYHHIIDPKTGKPGDSGLVSATVITDNPIVGDALSTAFFIKGKDEILKEYNKYNDVDFILIDENKNIYVSKSLENAINPVGEYSNIAVKVINS